MRSAVLIAFVLALTIPTSVEARPRFSLFIGVDHHPSHHRPHHFPTRYHFGHAGFHYRPYHGAFHGRYAVPQVYSPYRYGYRPGYFDDHAYRRGLYGVNRGYYYGPAVDRYHRDAARFPSYHYDRREGYIRGPGYHDRRY